MTAKQEVLVRIVRGDESLDCAIEYTLVPPWSVGLQYPHIGLQRFEGVDLFRCLQALRSELEKVGALLCCNGARRDCWPSPMSSQISGGLLVYELDIGVPATKRLDLFDAVSPSEVSSVAEQEGFYRDWHESLRRRV